MIYKRFSKIINTSYKNKLAFIFSVGILIPLLFVFIMGIFYTLGQTQKTIEDKIEIVDNDQRKKLDSTHTNIHNKLGYLTNSDTLKDILTVETPPSLSEMLDVRNQISEIETLFSLASSENLMIYTTNKNLKDTSFLRRITKKELDVLCNFENTRTCIEYINNELSLSVYKRYSTLYDKNTHLLNISVPLQNIFENSKYISSENLYFYYVNKNEKPIGTIISDPDNAPDVLKYLHQNRLKGFYAYKMPIPYIEGEFYIFKDIKNELTKNYIAIFIFVVVFLLFAATIFLLINILSKMLTNKLTSIIEEIDTDDIKTPKNDKNNIHEFYKIHNKLYELSSKLKKENEKLLKIELELLNQKISPHFLYNNLSAIKCRYNDSNLEEIIDLLSDYYRNNFNKNTMLTKIKEEKERIDIYVNLLKFAYEQNFSYSFLFDENLKDVHIMSDITQPLVENAFIHSINNTNEETAFLNINITQEDENILIEVSNNHFNEKDINLDKLADTSDDTKKSALTIMQRRINLYYGGNYKITFKKEDDVFFACVKLPYLK